MDCAEKENPASREHSSFMPEDRHAGKGLRGISGADVAFGHLP